MSNLNAIHSFYATSQWDLVTTHVLFMSMVPLMKPKDIVWSCQTSERAAKNAFKFDYKGCKTTER